MKKGARFARGIVPGSVLALLGFTPGGGGPDAAVSTDARPAREPITDPRRLIVVTVNQPTTTPAAVALAAEVDADLLLRGWFKWCDALDYARNASVVEQCHDRGMLFGGGVTCSAIYEGENGLSPERVSDMATRDARNRVVARPGEPRFRHGTLSNPAYLDYVLSWGYRQIDQGVDDLFMDEADGALEENEGYDDYSNADFRRFLLATLPPDTLWQERFQINLADPAIASDHSMRSFDYRAYLQDRGLADHPRGEGNPLAGLWAKFRPDRDARAWTYIRDALRLYAREKNHRVWVHGNGLIAGADLQVLGVWNHWQTNGDQVDFSRNQLREWAAIVETGRRMAGADVPVVLFHDWGKGYPWMTVNATQRGLWNRIRGAEIYAAGGLYAFPIHGFSGPDAGEDGTLDEIRRQSTFYHRNIHLYLDARMRSVDDVLSDDPLMGFSLWTCESPEPALAVHVINRHVADQTSVTQRGVSMLVPCRDRPVSARVVSPDWEGERTATCTLTSQGLQLVLAEVPVYAVVILTFEKLPELRLNGHSLPGTDKWGNIQHGTNVSP